MSIVDTIIEEEVEKMPKVYNDEYYKVVLGNNICNRHIKRFKENKGSKMSRSKIAPEEGNVLVSVYGTLKQGWGNHRLLERTPVVTGNIGINKIRGIGFPIVKLGDSHRLNVEVYEVNPSDLSRLDGLEGYTEGQRATFYDRKTVDVTLEDGTLLSTYVYEYVSEFEDTIGTSEDECEKDTNNVYNWIGGYRR